MSLVVLQVFFCLSVIFTVVDELNDLWKFDGTNWTWISGSNTINKSGIYETKGVPDPNNIPGSRAGAVSWIDSKNNLFLFGGKYTARKFPITIL